MSERPPFWTPRTAIGFLAFIVGVAFAAWMLHDRTLTWQALCACFLVSGAGLYFVEPAIMSGYVREAQRVAAEVRGHRVVQAGPGETVLVDRAEAPTAVVPPEDPPAEVRAGDPTTGAPEAVAQRRTGRSRGAARAAAPPLAPPPGLEDPPGLTDDELAAMEAARPQGAADAAR